MDDPAPHRRPRGQRPHRRAARPGHRLAGQPDRRHVPDRERQHRARGRGRQSDGRELRRRLADHHRLDRLGGSGRTGKCPALSTVAPGEKKMFRTGVTPVLGAAAARSTLAPPRYVQVKVSILRDLAPFAQLIARQARTAADVVGRAFRPVARCERHDLPQRRAGALCAAAEHDRIRGCRSARQLRRRHVEEFSAGGDVASGNEEERPL